MRRISIHAPRTGSDKSEQKDIPLVRRFQSTLPARGATIRRLLLICNVNISIHAPRTGSDHAELVKRLLVSAFQSTLPARGATDFANIERKIDNVFQSTLPARGATKAHPLRRTQESFQSTLPARGATPDKQAAIAAAADFNPRSPHGERRQRFFRIPQRWAFQSTLPARGATLRSGMNLLDFCSISIHAPRTGSDAEKTVRRYTILHFNPRSPHGERR